MEKKVKPIASKAQAKHFYNSFKQGKISYQDLMKSVHATPNMAKLPERVTAQKNTKLGVQGLI